ncbi:MAG: caspase family protein [Pseudomonadales bacterium]
MTSKSISILFIIVTIIGIATTAVANTRGISVQVRASEAINAPVLENVDLYQQSYALVIGIDEYTNGWPRLSNAVKDARLVAKALEEKNFSVDLHENLTSAELAQVFKRFFILKGEQPEARLFVWYAGHGATVDGEGYLVPADAPVIQAGSAFKFSSVALRDFGTFMRQSVSKHVYAVFDSCFAGTVFTAQRAMPPAAITRATTLPVRQFLTSGDADQTVSDDGQFRDLFIRAITGAENSDANGDGYLTASEIGMYLGDRITNLTEAAQTPRYGKLRDRDFDRGDFVFVLPETAGSQNPSSSPAEVVFWESLQDDPSPEELLAYISAYPNGLFTNLAKIKLGLLEGDLAPTDRLRPEIVLTPERQQYRVKAPTEVREGPSNQTQGIVRLNAGEVVLGIGSASMPEPWLSIARDGVILGYVARPLLTPTNPQPEVTFFSSPKSAPRASSRAPGSPDTLAPSFNDRFSQTLDALLENSDKIESKTVKALPDAPTSRELPNLDDPRPTLQSEDKPKGNQVSRSETSSPQSDDLDVVPSPTVSAPKPTEAVLTAKNETSAATREPPPQSTSEPQKISNIGTAEHSPPALERAASESAAKDQHTDPIGLSDSSNTALKPEKEKTLENSRGDTPPAESAGQNKPDQAGQQLASELASQEQENHLVAEEASSDAVADEYLEPQAGSINENWNLSTLDINDPPQQSEKPDRKITEFLRRYLISAAKGNQDAQLSLGYMYETGQRVDQDIIEAERWYTKAAQQNNHRAMLSLANLLISSEDPIRQKTAIKWYEKVGALGNADAQEILGYQYQTGSVVEADLTAATAWYLKAADQDRPAAQNNLARLYQLGQGVEKDLDQAIYWYERAAALGSEAAKNNLEKLLP